MKSGDCEWYVWRKVTGPSPKTDSGFANAGWFVTAYAVAEQEVVVYSRVVALELVLVLKWFVAVVAVTHRHCPSPP